MNVAHAFEAAPEVYGMDVEAARARGLEDGKAARRAVAALGLPDAQIVPNIDRRGPAAVVEAYRAGFAEAEVDRPGRVLVWNPMRQAYE